jgi:hypothetical protein
VSSADPILARRAHIGRLVAAGKRVGYALYGLAMVLFFVGFFADYTGALTTIIIAALVAGSLVLAPAIVFGYGIRAAEREERGQSRGH